MTSFITQAGGKTQRRMRCAIDRTGLGISHTYEDELRWIFLETMRYEIDLQKRDARLAQ